MPDLLSRLLVAWCGVLSFSFGIAADVVMDDEDGEIPPSTKKPQLYLPHYEPAPTQMPGRSSMQRRRRRSILLGLRIR